MCTLVLFIYYDIIGQKESCMPDFSMKLNQFTYIYNLDSYLFERTPGIHEDEIMQSL